MKYSTENLLDQLFHAERTRGEIEVALLSTAAPWLHDELEDEWWIQNNWVCALRRELDLPADYVPLPKETRRLKYKVYKTMKIGESQNESSGNRRK